jgi:hypothetical protein
MANYPNTIPKLSHSILYNSIFNFSNNKALGKEPDSIYLTKFVQNPPHGSGPHFLDSSISGISTIHCATFSTKVSNCTFELNSRVIKRRQGEAQNTS